MRIKLKAIIAAAFLLAFAFKAQAYIPPYWLIMSKTAESHGRGLYLVDQDVIFQTEGEPLVVNERWTLSGENEMRLEVTGRRQLKDRLRLTFVYDASKRYFIDENGVKKVNPISIEFFERVFHFRFSKNIKPYLVAAKVVPAESLKSEPHSYSKAKPHPESEPYVRLARSGGTITYNIGGLWIEQDRFAVKKLRYPSQTEIRASNYQTYSQRMQLPREREVTFGRFNAQIIVNSVNSIANTKQNKANLSHASLNFGKDPKLALSLPDEAVLREFYSRLR